MPRLTFGLVHGGSRVRTRDRPEKIAKTFSPTMSRLSKSFDSRCLQSPLLLSSFPFAEESARVRKGWQPGRDSKWSWKPEEPANDAGAACWTCLVTILPVRPLGKTARGAQTLLAMARCYSRKLKKQWRPSSPRLWRRLRGLCIRLKAEQRTQRSLSKEE